jgi:hypothetical protein
MLTPTQPPIGEIHSSRSIDWYMSQIYPMTPSAVLVYPVKSVAFGLLKRLTELQGEENRFELHALIPTHIGREKYEQLKQLPVNLHESR